MSHPMPVESRDDLTSALAVWDKHDPDDPMYEIIRQAHAVADAARGDAKRIAELEAALREHHNWHLQAGTIGLQDGDGGWVEIDNAAEYSDSAMYERTQKLLDGAAPEELQPMPRGGMQTWWWEQAIFLRRQVKALRKIISACASALPNGAAVSPEASIDFMQHLPGEISSVVSRLTAERDHATAIRSGKPDGKE